MEGDQSDTIQTAQDTQDIQRTIRSSARVRALKKEKDHPQVSASPQPSSARTNAAASSSSTTDKGKQVATPEPPRTTRRSAKSSGGPVTSSGIVINEPTQDPKGKKRAIPEPESSEDERQSHPPAPPPKKSRASLNAASSSSTTAYSLRPRKSSSKPLIPTTKPAMGKKTKATARGKAAALKEKASAAGPSTIMQDDGDIEMREPDAGSGDDYDSGDHHDENHEGEDSDDEVMADNSAAGQSAAATTGDNPPAPSESAASGAPGTGLGGLEEGAAAALFGSDYRAIGSYMMTLSSRLKTILENIKPKADPSTRLIALQELAELLSISTEDTLSGYFQIDNFVRELVKIMGGTGNTEDEDGDGGDDGNDSGDNEQDEDAALAAALAMSTGGIMPGDESLEAQMLACRCLANLMEALPGCAHTVVYHGAVPVLCSKLVEIQYIDLAEQTLSTLEKISEEYPSAIVREGGLSALLNYLDFFSTNVQRTALQAAANCCRNASVDNFTQIREVFPIIRNVLSYSDQRLVEYACLCVIRVIESFHRSSPDLLDSILDAETVKAINVLLLPAGGSPLVSPSTYTSFLRVLAAAAKSSPKTTLSLLDADIVSTMHQILTGVLPPTSDDGAEQGNAPGGQGVGGGVADMAVMQNLAHRPKEQVEEALSLVSELMPPLPKDGVFDHRAYSEKALAKMVKAKGKADRAAARAASSSAAAASTSRSTPAPPPAAPTPTPAPEEASGGATTPAPSGDDVADPQSQPAAVNDMAVGDALPMASGSGEKEKEREKDKVATRIEVLKGRPELVQKFLRSMVPILVDVYAASVALQVRTRSLTGLLKAVSWLEPDELSVVMKNVPLASFVGSILSSKDNAALIIGALQLVDLLLSKLPQQFRLSFRREGVLHEIDIRAAQDLTTKVTKPTPTPTPAPPPVVEAPPAEPVEPSLPPADPPTPTAAPAPIPPMEPVIVNTPSGMIVDGLPPSAILAAMMPPPTKRSSSSSIDPQDAIILRCRIIRFKYLSTPAQAQADDPFEAMQTLGRRLANTLASETELRRTLSELAGLFFGGPEGSGSVSSFELMKSGLVDELLEFSTAEGRKVDLLTRQRLLLEMFTVKSSTGSESPSGQSALGVLVKRLQESLTRLESFEVVTVSQGDDSKRGAASMLARQLRLRLVAAEGTTVPRNCTNITVSIHAIATFQALHDYLRPRVAGSVGTSGRMGGVLAAFAAAAGLPSGSFGRRGIPASGFGLPIPASSMPPPTSAPAPSSSAGTSASVPPPAPAPTSAGAEVGRRRSLRLRKEAPPAANEPVPAAEPAAAPAPAAPTPPGPMDDPLPPPSALADLMDDDPEDDYLGDDFDPDVYDDGGIPANERTVSVAIAEDGQKVEAQTPDGTRVATPNPTASASSSAPTSLPTKASYASALKAKPTDWHLQFTMDDHPLPLDMTIYGAVHQHIIRAANPLVPLSGLWNGVYTVKFKKVPGPVPLEGATDGATTERAASPMTTSVPDDAAHAKILRLLRVLHKLNAKGSERLLFDRPVQTLPESAFVNNKLTAKLSRQLEEPMIVASSCLPDWALDLPQHYPFLFPFATRFSFLQSTSFGYARLILKWQSQQTRSTDSNSRRDDVYAHLGRLQRQKVRISRKFLLESAIKVLELYGSSTSVLEVEYFDEVGTGLGPTLEFYSLVSREFARKNLKMWHDADPAATSLYVSHPTGLYPSPLGRKVAPEGTSVPGKKRIDIFRVLGQFVAKALLDSRIIDISLNKIFLKLILGEEVPLTIASLKLVDPTLAQSLSKLQAYVDVKHDIEANVKLSAYAKRVAIANVAVDGTKLEDLALDFTVPGYDIELKEGGKDMAVEGSNVEEYIREVLDTLVGRGVQSQAQAFREGFSKVFPVTDLQSFSSDELAMMFGNADEDWSSETLTESIKADHGFNIDSRAIRDLIDVMSSFDARARRDYLQFITGSPRLPVGGFRGLSPPLTVVRKPHEAPLRPDDYLPSVMTCVNYLKLPEYSSKEVMKKKLEVAMKEGVGSFHLS